MMKFLATTSLVATLALPAGAVQPAAGEELAKNQTYRFWLLDAVTSLDPARGSNAEGADILRQLFEGLMNEDASGAVVPGVAEGYDKSDDGLVYTFHLRDARWSNGDPVTAGDFVHAWRRVLAPDTASDHAWFMTQTNIENATRIMNGEVAPEALGARAIDDRTLEVTLTTPTPHFVAMLSHAASFPVPQAVIAEHGDAWTHPDNLVGNGAFVLQSHVPGVDITMQKNPEYWDAGNVVMQTVAGITVNDGNAGLARYQAGELDRVQIPPGHYPQLARQAPDEAVSIPLACTYAFVYNLSDKGPDALKDLRVRKALSLALQRDIIVGDILQGGQRPAATWTHWAIEGFAPVQSDLTSQSQRDRTARAAELLAEAGYGPDRPLALTLQYNTDEIHKKIAVNAQQTWKPLGVNLTLTNVEWGVHAERMQDQQFEIARYTWCADYNEASSFLDWFSDDGQNIGGWSNADFDRLMAEARTAEDPAPIHARAEQILATEMPAAFVYHYAKAEMINPKIKGLPMRNALNTWYAKDMYRLAE